MRTRRANLVFPRVPEGYEVMSVVIYPPNLGKTTLKVWSNPTGEGIFQ